MIEKTVRELIEAPAEALGFEIVRVHYTPSGTPTLQIMAERPDGTMNVEDCAELSRLLSAVLDVEDPIRGEYNLEVSSPGIDRPLVREKDFEAYAGFEAKVELSVPQDGQRRFRGTLRGVDAGNVLLEVEDESYSLPFDEIERAKLVLTDALINAHQAAAAQ